RAWASSNISVPGTTSGPCRAPSSTFLPLRLASEPLVERDRAGERDVQRLRPAGLRDRRTLVDAQVARQPLPLRAEQEHRRPFELDLAERRPVARDERDSPPRRVVERARRNAEHRAHGCPQRLRTRRIGAARRQCDERRPQRVGRTQQRADVPRIGDVPERQSDLRQRPAGQIVPPVDADHARRMRERRDLRQERRLDVLACDEQLDRLDAARGHDEILALDREEAELLPPAPLVQLADELQPLVVLGGDQALASAAFACSAICPNAAGSLTARSASTFRSSSMPALAQPLTNWLYDRPFARAAALIRMIQSRRNSRFLFFRSR